MLATLVTGEESTSVALGFVGGVVDTLRAVSWVHGVAILVNGTVTVGTLANEGSLGKIRQGKWFGKGAKVNHCLYYTMDILLSTNSSQLPPSSQNLQYSFHTHIIHTSTHRGKS